MKKDRFSELSHIWLDRAKDDLLWASDSFNDKHFSGVCFLSQQIAEKAFKAYLFFKKEKLIRTHDLNRLLEHCIRHDPSFAKLQNDVLVLNEYYIDTRYPDIWDRVRFEDRQLAEEALQTAKRLLLFVENKIVR